jgi:hypothetical protein
MTQTVTAEYIAGISGARQLMRASLPDWPDHESLCRDMLASTERALRAPGYPKPIRDGWRGERDFWRNQLKRYE